MCELTARLLAIIYANPTVQHGWKDHLSDWFLDLYTRRRTLDAHDILNGLFLFRPQLLERILDRPDLKDQLVAAMNPATHTPGATIAPQPTQQEDA